MRHYANNAKWLTWFAPFKALSISAAYLVPFFLEKGLDQSDIFLLQSIFSFAVVLLEVPSGWIADRIGRALSIKISAPIAAISMIAYGFSDFYWQFVLCEVLLATATVLISGADQALLIDSLKAEGKGDQYVRISQKIHSFGFAGIVAGLPISIALVHFIGISATIVADGIVTGIGALLVTRLVEPPVHLGEELDRSTAWQATKQLFAHAESRWLVALTVILSSATYMGAWLAAPYYASIGIPVLWFGAIYAGRSLIKAWLSSHVNMDRQLRRRMGVFVLFAVVPFVAIAIGKPWLVFAVLAHDVVHALQASPLAHRYNAYISSRYRAMLNSVVGLQTRLVYALLGPLVGFTIDLIGLQAGALVVGTAFGLAALIAFQKLVRLGSFEEGR